MNYLLLAGPFPPEVAGEPPLMVHITGVLHLSASVASRNIEIDPLQEGWREWRRWRNSCNHNPGVLGSTVAGEHTRIYVRAEHSYSDYYREEGLPDLSIADKRWLAAQLRLLDFERDVISGVFSTNPCRASASAADSRVFADRQGNLLCFYNAGPKKAPVEQAFVYTPNKGASRALFNKISAARGNYVDGAVDPCIFSSDDVPPSALNTRDTIINHLINVHSQRFVFGGAPVLRVFPIYYGLQAIFMAAGV